MVIVAGSPENREASQTEFSQGDSFQDFTARRIAPTNGEFVSETVGTFNWLMTRAQCSHEGLQELEAACRTMLIDKLEIPSVNLDSGRSPYEGFEDLIRTLESLSPTNEIAEVAKDIRLMILRSPLIEVN